MAAIIRPGNNASRIQPRHRFLGGRAIDDHRNARRNDHVDRADRGDQSGGEGLRITGPPHRRHHDLADGGDGRGAGAGDRAEDRRGADGGDAEAAAHRSDARLHEIDQPLRDAAASHQFAGVDEERHREQRVALTEPNRF